MSQNAIEKKTVVIVGAGFAGINAAKALSRNSDLRITLVDRRNYHLFQPLLYQVATAGLSPADIAVPIRSLFSKRKNVDVILGNVTDVKLGEKKITIEGDEFSYDYLILGTGAKHSYFGNEKWEENAPGLKTLEQATEIRRRIFLAFELAEKENDANLRKSLLTFVIVGGGPTGVELAGALGEISRYTLTKDFRHIDPKSTRVILIEAGKRILAAFAESLSAKATRDLEKLGVTVWTETRVTEVTENGVSLGTEKIEAKTVLWAAGVQPSSLNKKLGVEADRAGRVVVEKDLSLKEHPEVFVCGDASTLNDARGNPLPGLAPVAMQQGRFAAKQILNDLSSKKREEFKYFDKGAMATIGRKQAVLQFGGLRMSGFFAWCAWLFIHVFYLIGFKNRVIVLLQWAWSYFTFKRGARLIVSKEWRGIPMGKA